MVIDYAKLIESLFCRAVECRTLSVGGFLCLCLEKWLPSFSL